MADPESDARASLRRSLLIYTVLLAIDVAVVAYIVASGVQGAGYVTVSIVGAVGLLLAYEVWQHFRDTGARLAESEGTIVRKWKRADLIIFWDSFYIQVGRSIFKLDPRDYLRIEADMYVKIVHFPRTLHVVSIHEMRDAPPPIDAAHVG